MNEHCEKKFQIKNVNNAFWTKNKNYTTTKKKQKKNINVFAMTGS